MSQHDKFILTPISKVLEEAVLAIKHIGHGIETYPLSDYLMQSIFIKMTGAQEQKIKCIAWELATNDFDFRREFLRDFSGEFSSYKDKGKIYKKLIEQIKLVKGFQTNNLEKSLILSNSSIQPYFLDTNLLAWSHKDYVNFKNLWQKVKIENFGLEPSNNNVGLLKKLDDKSKNDPSKICLFTIYEEHVYRNRNRIAHNTKSFQQNLPTLEKLKSDDHKYENYFIWFSILMLIDNTFIELYKLYLETIEQKRFL